MLLFIYKENNIYYSTVFMFRFDEKYHDSVIPEPIHFYSYKLKYGLINSTLSLRYDDEISVKEKEDKLYIMTSKFIKWSKK